MNPATENKAEEDYRNTVYLSTNLNTRLVTTVSASITVSDLKKRIVLAHQECFPAIGNIKIDGLKVKRRGDFYYLSDSMPVLCAFGATKRNLYLSVDASRLEQDIDIQHLDKHTIGDQLALPLVMHNGSINESPLVHPKTIPAVDQIFSNVDGDSCKDVPKNIWNDRESEDKQLAVKKEINSKKRTRDVSNENSLKDPSGCELPVKKKRKAQRVKSNVNASKENIALKYDDDNGKDCGISMNNVHPFEHNLENKDLIVENTRFNNGEKCSDHQVAAFVPSGLEGVERETAADVATIVENNIQHGIFEKEKENEPVHKAVMENAIPTSSTSKYLNKDAIDSSQQDVGLNGHDSRGDLIDKHKEDGELSLKQGPEVKLSERRKKVKKSAAKKKNETLVMNADDKPVGAISSTVLAPISDEKVIGEKGEVLETTLIHDSKKNDEIIMKEMEVSEPNNSLMKEKSQGKLKDTVGRRNRKKDVEKTSLENDKFVVKQANDVATSIDACVDSGRNDEALLNNDVGLFRTEKNTSLVLDKDINDKSEKQNEKTDGVKKDKRKKKTRKSASRNEAESIMKDANGDICDNLKEVDGSFPHTYEGLVGKEKKDNEFSLTVPQDQLSHDQSTEIEFKSKKSQSIDHSRHLEDTSKNVAVSEVSKVNNEVSITNEGSHESNLLDHFAPGHQPNKTASVDNGKDRKKLKKNKKDDSSNDGDIKYQKIISENEGVEGKAKKNNKSSLTGPQDQLSKDQSTVVELESKKSQSIDHSLPLDYTSKNVTVSEVSKSNNKVDIPNDESQEINFHDHFASGHQPKNTASVDNGKHLKKLKKKTKDGDMKSQKVISESEGLVGKLKKNNKSSLTNPQDRLSKDQSTEVELESKKNQSINHHHHLEDASKNVAVSEVSKVNNEVDTTNEGSHEINFLEHFTPARQPNKTASVDNGKDANISKKKTKFSKNENNKVVTDPNIPKINQRKIQRTTRSIDSESSSSSKSFGSSFHIQKSNKQQSVLGPVKKVSPVVNSLLNTPGKIFGDDDSDSSADDNATINSNSSTRTPSRKSTSSSSGETASSIDSRRNSNWSHAMKRKGGGGSKSVTSQNQSKKVSMTDLFRSSSRFKKAKFSTSQVRDSESQPVDFVPDSQPLS